MALVLAGGAADPPRAARLVSEVWAGSIAAVPTIVLDGPPTTIEAVVVFATPVTAEAQWGLTLTRVGRDVMCVSVDSQGFFTLTPYLSDTTFFIHLKRGEQPNEIYLHLEADGMATLRLNREIAWQGRIDGPLTGIVARVWEESANGRTTLRYLRHYGG